MAEAASVPKDALTLVKDVLQASPDTVTVAQLEALYVAFEAQPGTLPLILPKLLPLVDREQPVREWTLNYLDLAFCRGVLKMDLRQDLAPHVLDAILSYVYDPNPAYNKKAIQCFASAYPSLFHHFIVDLSQGARWSVIQAIRERLTQLFEDPTTHAGTKVAIIKAFQRIILVHVADAPASQHPSRDVNVSHIPPNHPTLHRISLEQDGKSTLVQLLALIFQETQVDLVIAAINTLATLARQRPEHVDVVFQALSSWTPANLPGRLEQRFAEKALRTFFRHMIRFNVGGHAYKPSWQGALEQQVQREALAEAAFVQAREAEAKRKREELAVEIAMAAGVKRPRIDELSTSAAPALAPPPAPPASIPAPASIPLPGPAVSEATSAHTARAFQSQDTHEALANFDVTQLPLPVVVDLVIANFEAISEATLEEAVSRTRASLEQDSTTPTATKPEEDVAPQEVGPVLDHFELAPPSVLAPSQANDLMKGVVARMTKIGMDEIAARPLAKEEEGTVAAPPSYPVLWSSLISRLTVRGLYVPLRPDASEDELQRRDAILKYADQLRAVTMKMVLEDPERRLELASRWFMEEWTSDHQRRRDGLEGKYETMLLELLSGLSPKLDAESKWLLPFIEDLPALPSSALDKLVGLTTEKNTVQLGLFILREIATSRPPVRPYVSSLLLGMTRSSDELLRRGAITTVRVWVTNATPPPPLQPLVLDFAYASLACLTEGLKAPGDDTLPPSQGQADAPANGENVGGDVALEDSGVVQLSAPVKSEVQMDEDQAPASTSAPEGPEGQESALAEPAPDPRSQWDEDDVLRYLELTLALCVKVPTLLRTVFDTYAQVNPTIRSAMEKHITRLIASMGPHHPVLLELLSDFPEGADGLALTVFQIMFDKERSPALVQLILTLSQKRTLDPRFLIPVLPELKKSEVLPLLPRIISLLGDETMARENLDEIRYVFESVVIPPEEAFGSTNQPRTSRENGVAPTELMGLLHRKENEIGKKAAARAIQICLNMPTVFKAEVLAATMNQIVEEPVLPTIFLRTVLMAVDKFPSLKGYVSGNLLSRLITKKIWLDPILWTGFIMAAKKTTPGSYAALAQLPKDQMRYIAAQDADLREGLREYFVKKTSNNPARLRGVLELLGVSDQPDQPDANAASPTPGP